MKKNIFGIIISLTAVLFIISCEQKQAGDQDEKKDDIVVGEQAQLNHEEIEDLIISAMVNNRLQIALIDLAKDKEMDMDCQAFCDLFYNHHKEFQATLGRIAMSYDVDFPEGLTPTAQAVYNRLNNLGPEEFEKEFLGVLIKHHREDLEHFEKMMILNEEVVQRGMIEEVYDALKEHLRYAEKAMDELS